MEDEIRHVVGPVGVWGVGLIGFNRIPPQLEPGDKYCMEITRVASSRCDCGHHNAEKCICGPLGGGGVTALPQTHQLD